ncbi:MAG TPA: MmcQ/YjbR family DNA-binding protein, partial [Armatimonadota bacterium]|nr:MmcQ/YjbR family DNA-binding protein [Armatimonadota bacterium]
KNALMDFCRSRPGATEDVKWEDHLVFSVGGKMFAIFDVAETEPVRLKVDPAVFPILIQQPDISPAPYLARQSWIRIEHAEVLVREAFEDLLRESHELVVARLSRKMRERLGIATG